MEAIFLYLRLERITSLRLSKWKPLLFNDKSSQLNHQI